MPLLLLCRCCFYSYQCWRTDAGGLVLLIGAWTGVGTEWKIVVMCGRRVDLLPSVRRDHGEKRHVAILAHRGEVHIDDRALVVVCCVRWQ